MPSLRVLVLHNQTAGDEDHSAEEIGTAIRRAGHEFAYRSIKDADWEQALDEPADLIAIAGGDGTVAEVLVRAAGSAHAATILPLGSANNIARTLGLADRELGDLIAGWEDVPRGRYRLGRVQRAGRESLFAEAFGGGLFAASLVRAAEVKRRDDDKVDLGLELLRELVDELPAPSWRIRLDGAEASGDYLAVEAMVIGWTGPSVPLAPGADPYDDLLDVVLVSDDDRPTIAAYLDERIAGGDPAPPELATVRCRIATLEPPASCPLRIDDEAEQNPGGSWSVTVANTGVVMIVP